MGLFPPEAVRGMKVLERDKFCTTANVPFVDISVQDAGKNLKLLKPFLLKMPNLPAVRDLKNDDDQVKRVLLNPNSVCDLPESLGAALRYSDVELSYDNFRTEDILNAVLPADQEGVSGYSRVGHIVHLNLKQHNMDYKALIGQVILDKNKGVKTVVNKSKIIETTYRFFEMEILAGEKDMEVEVIESKCRYRFDFSKVYWNPRLQTEHQRIVEKLKKGDVVFDVFAGVGPFAIPAAKKGCQVFANDLNPESYKWLQKNSVLNKVEQNTSCFCKDGRQFIMEDLRDKVHGAAHVIMNLPAIAVEFLDAFQGLFRGVEDVPQLRVHVYCFVKTAEKEDATSLATDLVEQHMQCSLQHYIVEVRNVRNVAPAKEMICVSFDLPKHILQGKRTRTDSEQETKTKRTAADDAHK